MISSLPLDSILKKALKNGGDYAELYFESSRKTTIVCDDRQIETVVSGIDSGVGFRVIGDLKTAFGHSNDISQKSLEDLAAGLSETFKTGGSQKDIVLQRLKPALQFPILKNPASVPLDQKVKMIREADKLAWGLDPRIVQVKVRYLETERNSEIAHSEGAHVINPKTLLVLAVSITVSKNGQLFSGFHSMGGHLGYELFDEEKIEDTVQQAVNRALINLSADRAKGGTMPVVISAKAGGTLVHEAVGHGLEADLACQGLSVYEGKLGQQIASPLVTVVDDPTVPKKRGSYAFDDEGTPAQCATLIEKGVLKDFMFDRLTAMKTGNQPNGHGRRESYKHRPIVRMTNTMILPGKDDPAEIIRSVPDGLFVAMMGGGQVNTVNGDFMFEVTEGYMIENGKIGKPVRGATLTGNGPDVLKAIDRVGNDLGFSIGTCGKDGQGAPVSDAMPTVRIPEMVVGGLVE